MSDTLPHQQAPTTYRRLELDEVLDALGPVDPVAKEKLDSSLGMAARRFIAHAPFAVLATTNGHGADASPRGDGPGFIRVLDENTLSMPDRTGNALADSFRNTFDDPHVGLLFLVPGMRESLRVNGTGYITDDMTLRRMHEMDGRLPKLVMIINVEEIFFHCGKALVRSRLWDPDARVDPLDVTLGCNVFSLRDIESRQIDATSAAFNEELEVEYVVDL